MPNYSSMTDEQLQQEYQRQSGGVSSGKKDYSSMSNEELMKEYQTQTSGGTQTSSGDSFLSGINVTDAPEESPLTIGQRAKVGFGTTLESKAAIIKSFGKQDVQVTADRKLLVDGKPYDSNIFSMKELLSDLVDHTGSLTEMAPAIAADAAAIAASGPTMGSSLLTIMGANAAGMAAGTGIRKGIAQGLGGEEGGPKEYAQEMGVSAGVGAIGGAAPFAYGTAVREVGRVSTLLAKRLGDDLPKLAKFFAKIEPAASNHLVDFAKKGILPSQVITPTIAKKEFVDNAISKALVGTEKDKATATYLAGQIHRTLKNTVGVDAATKKGYIKELYQTAIPELKVLGDEEFDILTRMGASELNETIKSVKYNVGLAKARGAENPMERVVNEYTKAFKEARRLHGESVQNARAMGIKPGHESNPSIEVGDFLKSLFSEMQEDFANGPQILRGTDVASGIRGAERGFIKSFLERFAGAPSEIKVVAEKLGFTVKELEARAPALYKEAMAAGEVTKMSPNQLISFEKEFNRLMDNVDRGTQVGAFFAQKKKQLGEIMKKTFGKNYENKSAKYHSLMESFRAIPGLENAETVPQVGDALKRALKDGDWNEHYTNALKNIRGLASEVGVNMRNPIEEIGRVRISSALNSARIKEGISQFSMGTVRAVAGEDTQGAFAQFVKGADDALPNSLKFMEDAKKHYIAREFTRKDIDFYHLKSLFYLMGGSQIATGLHQAGVPGPIATGTGFLIGMKGMRGLANKDLMTGLLARKGLAEGGRKAELGMLGKEAFKKAQSAMAKSPARYGAEAMARQSMEDRTA